ncbi:hypothetical protein [Streptomyces sp. NPDC001070]
MQVGVGRGDCVVGWGAGVVGSGAEVVEPPPAGAVAPELAGAWLAEAEAEGDADSLSLAEALGDAEALALRDAEASDAGFAGSLEASPLGEEVSLGEVPSVRVSPEAAESVLVPVT